MKKKIVLTLIYISIFFWITLETDAFLWFQVKKSTDSSYVSSLENVSQNQELTFNVIRTDWSTSNRTFLVNMPSWFTYNWYTNNWCANFSLKTNSNSSFSYSYDYSFPCNVTFRYTPTTATAWNKQINLLYDWTATTIDVSIASSAVKTITKALTKDLDNDWYIDAYKIDFSSAVSDISTTWVSWLTVWWYSVTYSWTTTSWYISFQDWIFNTGERPQIISSWNIFWDVWQLSNDSIVEEDWAKPVLLKVNNQNVIWVNNVSIWTWTITFEFSEKLHPESIFYFKKWTSLIATLWSSNINNEKLIYTPSTELSIWSYSLDPSDNAKDYSSNLNVIWSISISLLVNDLSAPTWLTIWAATWISINNWTSITNNRYVQLSLLASDNVWVHQMWISNDSSFSSWNWENYSESKINWDLWATTWLKTVYIKFRDAAWNVSPTYSSTITYSTWTNYLNFNTPTSLYTDSTSINLDWWCNNSTSTISYSINDLISWTITCDSNKTWTNTFSPLTPNTQNQIKIWYWADYNSATIKNSIVIINPQTICNSWFTRVWSTCVPNSCEAETKTVSWKVYQVPAMSHLSSWNITSNSISITWWTITYNQSFSCSTWILTSNWSAVANTPTCNSWYSINWSSCIPSSCTAQTKTVDWKTYQVPAMSHWNSWNVTSNNVSITWWSITYTQNFSCSFWVISENWSTTTNTPNCNSWYAINWNQCTLISALACISSYTDWDKIYWVWTITHLWTWARTSSPISISNWTITYNQQFSCNATILTKIWNATANTPTCNSWYSVSWSSCVPSNCSAETKTVSSWRTYQVPSLIHDASWTITSNNVSITWWRITYSQTFKCELWVVSEVWSETTNTPTCNSWYKVDWLTCVKKSSWWWGGGWWWGSFLQTCNTSTDLECRVSWTKYIWQVKFWANCQWWDVGKVCSDEVVKTWTSNNNYDLWKNFSDYISKNGWGANTDPTLEITRLYLLENTSKSFTKLIEDFRNKIYDKNIEYFTTFDKDLKNKYISTLISYKNLFENLDKQLNNNDSEAALNAKSNYSELDKYISEIKTPENRYITKKQDLENTIFETKVTEIKNTMSWIEKVMFLKYKKLLQTNTINKEKYNEIVDDYNNFVLYLSIFRTYKDEKAWILWKEYLSKIVKHYNTKIAEKKIVVNNVVKTTQKIIDVFPITKDLKFWDYNNEVTMLQNMLKHYWYFEFEATWYFWNATWASLEKFTKDFLKINYDWYLNDSIRQKLKEMDY